MIHNQFDKINNKFLYFIDRFRINLGKPNLNAPKKVFNDNEWQKSFEDLMSNGCAKLPIKFKLQDYDELAELSDPNFKFDDFVLSTALSKFDKYGKSLTCLNMKSQIIRELFSKKLYLLIKNFYGGEFYLRNCPFLRLDVKNKRELVHDQSLFHLDHAVRQLTIIIFIKSIDESSSHTKYIEKTHLNSWLNLRERDFNRHSNKFKKIVDVYKSQNKIKSLVGKKGEAFIFDAGNGLHRGFYGNDRAIIHLTFNKSRRHAYYNKNFESRYRINASNDFEKYYFGPLEFSENLLKEYESKKWSKETFKYLLH